jgi:Ca-activated chloride channel family protein
MTMTTPAAHNLSTGCRLVATDGRVLPLRAVDLDVDAAGGLARVRVRQTFVNPHAEPLGATYALPLPADGAVVDFAFTVAGRRVQGRVARRADARAAFEQAVASGRTAALLEQDRSSLFTQELGNLPPGAVVEVEIDVEQPLAWRDGGWEWRFPTVVAPRFQGAVIDVADTPPAIPCRVGFRIGDATTAAASSPSHDLGDGLLLGTLDRDVVLRWPVAAPSPGVSLEVTAGEGEAYGLLTVVPPSTPLRPVPRDLILLLDTSGSMGGVPLQQLQAFARALTEGLGEADQLEIIEFSRTARRWRPGPVPATSSNRADALAFVDALRASGGTHMHDAIREALRPLRAESVRQVVLVTDGLIGFETEVVGHVLNALPPGCRLHTVGIGSAPNRSLTGPAARAGAGFEAIVGPHEPVAPVVAELLARAAVPQVVDLTVHGDAVLDRAPIGLPDLCAASPTRIALRLRPGGGPIRLTGRTATGTWSHELVAAPAVGGRRVVATRYARERVEDLELRVAAGEARAGLDAEIEALGLRHAIATRMTSWVAETAELTVDPGAPTRHEGIPQTLPFAMSAEGVGLRAAAAPPSPARALMAMPTKEMARRRRAEPAASVLGFLTTDDLKGFAEKLEAPAATRRLRARVRLHRDGQLILEVDGPVSWDASGTITLELPDGSRVTVTAAPATTRPTELAPGLQARLVIAWAGPLPRAVHLANLVLEV